MAEASKKRKSEDSSGESGSPENLARLRRRYFLGLGLTIATALAVAYGYIGQWGGYIDYGRDRANPFVLWPGPFELIAKPIPHLALAKIPVVPIGALGTLAWRPKQTGWINQPHAPRDIATISLPVPVLEEAAGLTLIAPASADDVGALPDLVPLIGNFELDEKTGDFSLTANVGNRDDGMSDPTGVLLRTVDGGVTLATAEIPAVAPRESYRLEMSGKIDLVSLNSAGGYIALVVDPGDFIAESDESNNTIFHKITASEDALSQSSPLAATGPNAAADNMLGASCSADGNRCLVGTGRRLLQVRWENEGESEPIWQEVSSNGIDTQFIVTDVFQSAPAAPSLAIGTNNYAYPVLLSDEGLSIDIDAGEWIIDTRPVQIGAAQDGRTAHAFIEFSSGLTWHIRKSTRDIEWVVARRLTRVTDNIVTGLDFGPKEPIYTNVGGRLQTLTPVTSPMAVKVPVGDDAGRQPIVTIDSLERPPGRTYDNINVVAESRAPSSSVELRPDISVNPDSLWIAGDLGLLVHGIDNPQSLQSLTKANLRDIHFQDNEIGWVTSGWNDGNEESDRPVVLQTLDGGATWERLSYRHWPAPWTLVLTFVLLFVGPDTWRARRNFLTFKVDPGIASVGKPDSPVGWEDDDVLGLQPIALALSRFMRNRDTTPAVTFAVTGAWGTGKSSVMNLTAKDLRLYGARAVWFNAWHHQKEEHLLAALLEAVRTEASPPWWMLSGGWFRARLQFRRLPRALPVLALVGLPIVVVSLLIGLDNIGGALADFAIWIAALLESENIEEQLGGVLAGFGSAGTALYGVWRILSVLKVIPTDPSRLMSVLTTRASMSDISGKLSLRHKFAVEFKELCIALRYGKNPGVIVMVDDLDRCRPDAVLDVLEAVNFLVSAGRCFVILGIDVDKVRDAVAAGFKDQVLSLKNANLAPDGASLNDFARSYLEKLINIPIRVPEASEESVREMLVGKREPEQGPKGLATWLAVKIFGSARRMRRIMRDALDLAGGATIIAVPVFLVLLFGVTTGTTWVGELNQATLTDSDTGSEEKQTTATKQTKVIEPSDPDKPLPPIEPLPDEPLPEEPQPEEPQPEELLSPDVSSPEIEFPIAGVEDLSRMPAWIAWLIAVIGVGTLVGMVLRNALGSTESVISDTGTYKAALEDWSDAIYAAAGTARGVKRFHNKLRFLAMLNRGVTAPYKWVEKLFSDKDATETPESIPEPWLVSFGAVENAFPDRFKKFEKVDSDYLSRQLFETDKAVVRDQVVKAFGKPSWVRLAGTQSSQFLVRYRKLTGLTEHAPERDSTSPENIPDLAANDHRD